MRFFRHFQWIADDFNTLCEQLKKPDTWILIAMLTLFGALSIAAIYFLLRFDSTLRLRHLGSMACQEIGNWQTVGIYFAGMAFGLAMVISIGEFAQYVDNKKRDQQGSLKNAQRAILLATAASVVGGGMMFFLQQLCA